MKEELICPICGEPTSVYMGNARKDKLCRKHGKLANAGEIEQCPDCGKWHETNKQCECKKANYVELPNDGFNKCILCGNETTGYAFCIECWRKYTNEELLDILNNKKKSNLPNISQEDIQPEAKEIESNNVIIIDDKNKSKCITCGRQTDGLLFCASCYRKYKNKELLFRIKNCTNIELLDEDYEGRYTCKDGHIVKSKSERDIDNYLYDHGIMHAYERELPYGANNNEVLHPDFYLPDYLGQGKDVYIEHWGYNENNIQYTKTKKFKLPIYEKLGITLICTDEKADMAKIDTVLDRKLNKKFIIEGQINGEQKSNPKSTKTKYKAFDNDEDIPF